MWFAISIIVSIALSFAAYALQPKPKAPSAPKAQDITSPTLDAGTPLQVIFGRMRARNPNTLYYGGDRTEEIKK